MQYAEKNVEISDSTVIWEWRKFGGRKRLTWGVEHPIILSPPPPLQLEQRLLADYRS